MKKDILLFVIFIIAIFFYPVFAHADKIGYFISQNTVSEPIALFVFGAGLLILANFTRNLVKK
ncbi:hypothetical protein [Desulfobacula sp.]|uniref:hypothetical protein n=1 Tax=Desulfobacula sp. TaxID=2593537 RepID=UPI00261F5BE6|nr:hypothetical protein [Desulfobacula sp.]